MDYSKLSDFEINSAVHNAKLREPYSLVFMGDDRIAWTKENGEQIITERVPYAKHGVHDYCNNPADAWTIITNNRIAIIPDSADGEWVAFNEFTLYEGDWMFASDPTHHSNGKNPLRAAMIVFLMMQESK